MGRRLVVFSTYALAIYSPPPKALMTKLSNEERGRHASHLTLELGFQPWREGLNPDGRIEYALTWFRVGGYVVDFLETLLYFVRQIQTRGCRCKGHGWRRNKEALDGTSATRR